MKTWRACLGCGGAFPRSQLELGRCAKCLGADPKRSARLSTGHWSQGRDRGVQAGFRRGLMARAGGRCEAVVGGARCPETEELQAHHLPDGAGVLLCRQHHKLVDPMAR